MSDKQQPIILEGDVYALTEAGQREIGGGGTSLSALDLKVLVLIDGDSTVRETLGRTEPLALGREVVVDSLRRLVEGGLIELSKAEGGSLDFVDFLDAKAPGPSQASIAEAKKATAATTQLLQKQGYFVRIVRRAASRRAASQDAPTVLAIEDEPVMLGLVKFVMSAQGFAVRTAMNRREIVEQLRCLPVPDLILLDVLLPDVDGFLVLNSIRQHPALQAVPVIMLTAKATRGSVLRGLAGGADGYITKPFEVPVLVNAVRTVLGLPEVGQAKAPGN